MPPRPPSDIDRRVLLQGTAVTLAVGSAAPVPSPSQPKDYEIALGDPVGKFFGYVKVRLHKNDSLGGLTYFAPHYSETTAPEAAQTVIDRNGGKVAWLVHGDEHRPKRNVSFVLEGARFEFDPNRMFTEVGARKSLAMFSNTNTRNELFSRAVDQVNNFATALLSNNNYYLHPTMAQGKVVVGIHNNHGGYSVESYKPGGEYHKEIERNGGYYYNQNGHPGNFFYTTSEAIFEVLKQNKFSVVLQTAKPTDDGSLSVYCGTHNVDYINVEAELSERDAQTLMIQFLHDYIAKA
jgi:hypothetical protein